MRRLVVLYRSSLGKKVIVAATGIVMLGFLLGHMSGNLKVFLPDVDGVADIDIYGKYLREIGVPLVPHAFALWLTRLVLLGSLILHVVCVMQLSVANQSARPVDYQKQSFARATPSARWMMYTGTYLLAFIVFHILHLTVGAVQPDQFEHGRVYQNLQQAFDSAPWAVLYLISMCVVAMHLYHGAWSLFQTLGWDNPDRNQGLRRLAVIIALILFIGFVAVPMSFLLGVLKPKETKPATSHASAIVQPIDVESRQAAYRI